MNGVEVTSGGGASGEAAADEDVFRDGGDGDDDDDVEIDIEFPEAGENPLVESAAAGRR